MLERLIKAIKADPQVGIGLGFSLPLLTYAIIENALIAIVIFGMATAGLLYGLYESYTKTK